jgi:hypothetical protein
VVSKVVFLPAKPNKMLGALQGGWLFVIIFFVSKKTFVGRYFVCIFA